MATFINVPKSAAIGSILLEDSVDPILDFLLTEDGFELEMEQNTSIYINAIKH